MYINRNIYIYRQSPQSPVACPSRRNRGTPDLGPWTLDLRICRNVDISLYSVSKIVQFVDLKSWAAML